MTIRPSAVVAIVVLVAAGCSGGDGSATSRSTTSPVPVTTTATPPTTTATGTADQQVCAALGAIEARGFQSNAQELLQISATGAEATTDEIVTDSAFLSAAAVAGDLRRAGEVVVGLLEVCRGHGFI